MDRCRKEPWRYMQGWRWDGGLNQGLGTWKRNQARTRGGVVRMANRSHITQALKAGPTSGCTGLPPKPVGRARGQDSDVGRSPARSFGSKRQMQEEFGNILLCWMALWFRVQMTPPPKLGTSTLKEERLAYLSPPQVWVPGTHLAQCWGFKRRENQ